MCDVKWGDIPNLKFGYIIILYPNLKVGVFLWNRAEACFNILSRIKLSILILLLGA